MTATDTETESPSHTRVTWGSKMESVLSLVGYAVGLGNIWRFPYLCMRNGGGAFLIPYAFSLIFCGIPIYYLELYFGQFSSRSPTEVWNICPMLRGIGWGTIIYSSYTCFYVILMAWVLHFLFYSFSVHLPWSTCDNEWNTYKCLKDTHQYNISNNAQLTNESMINTNLQKSSSSSEEYFEHKVLDISEGIEDIGGIKFDVFICYCAAWLVVYLCLCKGVKSIGKVVYVTATMPYILLVALVIRGLTLPGAVEGIKYFLVPDFTKLLEPKVWVEANLQVFFSLGISDGGIITIASYSKFNNKFYKEAVGVPLINVATSLLGGVAIFSVIGFMAEQSGLSVDTVIRSGPGLAFVAYPEALARMPAAPVWAVFFFITLVSITIDSFFASIEAVISGLEDAFPRLRTYKVTFTSCLIFVLFIIGIPTTTRGGMYVFQVIDWYAGCFCLFIFSFIECFVVVWVYGHKRFEYDIEYMTGERPSLWWKICLCITTPLMLFVSMVYILTSMIPPYYGSYYYPWWAIAFGWIVASIPIIPVITGIVSAISKQNGSIVERIQKAAQPNFKWGPANSGDRLKYKHASEYPTEGLLMNKMLEASASRNC